MSNTIAPALPPTASTDSSMPSASMMRWTAEALALIGYRPADAFLLGLDSGVARALALSMATAEALRSCIP
jgi:hypothetical protein